MKGKKLNKKFIGSVNICISKIDIWLDTEDVSTCFFDDGSATMHLKIDEPNWGIVFSDFLHELEETYLFKTGKQFCQTNLPENFVAITNNFNFTHDDFQLMCHDIGTAIAKIYPTLWLAHDKIHGKKQPNDKKK